MSSSSEDGGLRRPPHTSTRSHFQGGLHEYAQEDFTSNASHRLLRYVSSDESQRNVDGDGSPVVYYEDLRPAATPSPGSPGFSTLSYDSLEESPDHNVDQSPAVPKPGSQHRSGYCGWLPTTIWSLEILNCVIASLCLAAIVGILSMYQGLPLPQWRFNITINALISIFTAIFKMALTMPIAEGMYSGIS